MKFDTPGIIKKTFPIFLVSFLLLLAVSFIAIREIDELFESEKVVRQTYKVSGMLNQVLSTSKDVYLICREYVITGNEKDLEMFEKEKTQLDQNLLELQELVDDKIIMDYIHELKYIIRRQIEGVTEQKIRLRREEGFDAARAFLIKSKESSLINSQLSELIIKIQVREKELLKLHTDISSKNAIRVRIYIIAGSLLSIITLAFALILIYRDARYSQKLLHDLAKSEGKILQFLEFIPMGITIFGKDGKYFFTNSKSKEILRTEPANALPREMARIFNGFISGTNKEYPKQKTPALMAMAGKKVDADNLELRFSDKTIPLHVMATPVYGIHGEAEFSIVIFEDISIRKQYEQELQRTKEQLGQTIEIAQVGHWDFHLKSRVFTWSDKMYELFGISKDTPDLYEEFIKQVDQHDQDFIQERMTKAIQTKIKSEIEFSVRQPDGSRKYVFGYGIPVLSDAGNVYAVKGTLQDITERKNMEDELVKAKHMAERSVIMKDAFLANMSHEIRTPLNAIIGFAELLGRRKFENEETEFIKAIKTSGENLLVIINDILDFSKIEAGMMTFEIVPFNMEELFNAVHLMLSQKAKDKNLSLFFDCDQDIPKTLSGDPTRLSQIIINIVGNAIKFTTKGSIHVTANVIEQKQETVLLELRIKDTGIGISKDKLDLIFERFSQAETDTTRKYGGTGLGLSITKSLIELQGGFITVNSKLGEGTEFIFQLPFIKVKGSKSSKLIDIQAEKLKTRNVKVLLVDDNEMNIKLGMAVLSEAGMKADTASNGLEAIKYLEKNAYDVVLMDIQMPEMDGFQATEAIRNVLKSEIPIIAMTANALSGEREKCIANGMNDYISKPFKPKDLIQKINTIASKGNPNENPTQFSDDERNDKLIDIDILLETTNKNKTITIEIMEMFSHQIPQLLRKIDDELKAGNYSDAKRTIHKTKSSVSIIGSGKTKNLLEKMENLSDTELEEKIFKLNDQLQKLGLLLIDQVKAEKVIFENSNL